MTGVPLTVGGTVTAGTPTGASAIGAEVADVAVATPPAFVALTLTRYVEPMDALPRM